jgi:glycosyltransferase involved in cell wall biosynthesis
MKNDASIKRRRLRVLHVVAEIREQAMAYHEFVAGMADRNDLSVVSLHKAKRGVPPGVRAHEGDGTLPGLMRALRTALRQPFDVYHVHFPNVSAPFLLMAFWRRGVMRRAIFTFHTSFEDLSLRNRILFFFVLCFFRRIVCCSRSSLLSLPPLWRRLAGNRLILIRNGVNIRRIEELRAGNPKRANGAPTLVTACRLVKVKDVRTIIEALRLSGNPETRLVIIGNGPERPPLARLSAQAGIGERVEFTGEVDRQSVYERMLASDIFISASRVEGLPLAVMEAMACGLPVVLSDIPPHREIVGDDCVLVSPGDAAGFAKQIARILAMSAAGRREMGEKNRLTITSQFGLDAMFDAYENLYREVVGSDDVPERRSAY